MKVTFGFFLYWCHLFIRGDCFLDLSTSICIDYLDLSMFKDSVFIDSLSFVLFIYIFKCS